jgi:hypothetical protein
LPHLAREIGRVESDPAATAQDYFVATGLANRWIRVQAGDGAVEGRWSEIDLSMGLGIVVADGSLRRVRLEHVRALTALEL